MKQKILALTIIASSLFSLNVVAQDHTSKQVKCRAEKNIDARAHKGDMRCLRPFEADQNLKRIRPDKSALNGIVLTPDQHKKVDALKEKNRKEAQKTREKRAKEKKQKAEKMDKEMKKILTAEQYARYQANKQQMKNEKSECHSAKKCKKHAPRPEGKQKCESAGCCTAAPASSMPAPGCSR